MSAFGIFDGDLKKKRKPIHPKLQKAVRAVQKYSCASCGESLKTRGQLHHINGNNSDDRITNLEYLCSKCHKRKNAEQAAKRAKEKAQEKKRGYFI